MSKDKPPRLTRKRRLILYAIATIIGVSVAGYNAMHSFNFTNSKEWNFDSYQSNTTPQDLAMMETDPPGTWVIKNDNSAPSPPNVLAVFPENNNATYHIQIIPDSPIVTEAEASVKFKILPGHETELAGLVVRFVDKSHYFVLIADPMNNRLSLCKSDIQFIVCNYESVAQISVGQWHELKASISSQGIGGYLDGAELIKANNEYYQNGQIGLWSKADSEVYFDDLKLNY